MVYTVRGFSITFFPYRRGASLIFNLAGLAGSGNRVIWAVGVRSTLVVHMGVSALNLPSRLGIRVDWVPAGLAF